MKIALLHGAVVNAGDFLIKKRTKELLQYFYPKAEIYDFFRNKSLLDCINDINECNVAVLAGGPLLIKGLKNFPLLDEYNRIKIPVLALGLGWYGHDSSIEAVYGYTLDEKLQSLMKRCGDHFAIGCRDYYSLDILRNIGIENTIMTGCPAWYYLPDVDNNKLKFNGIRNVKKICISDASNPRNKEVELSIIEFVRKFFGGVQIVYVMHRDDWTKFSDFKRELSKYNVDVLNISNSENGFMIYDDCDMHIGFRVHAHIYNLSKRRYSILIEEDGRGNGVNDALGLPRIKAYNTVVSDNETVKVPNKLANYQVEDCILNYERNDYIRLTNAFELMTRYFNKMTYLINTLEDMR